MTGEQARVPKTEELLAAWRAAAEPGYPEPADRVHEERPPWDLDRLLRVEAAGTTAVLELGGAEPSDLGGEPTVVHQPTSSDDEVLPYPDRCFDVVLARGVPFRSDEIARVLRPCGVFLTEQLGADDVVELHAVLSTPLPHPERTLASCTRPLFDVGLRVTREEAWHGPIAFDDVAALVAKLARHPELVPGFTVEGYANTLLYLHLRAPAWGQPLAFTRSRFLVRAERPL